MKMDYPKIVVFILLSLLFDIAEESCKANVNIPSLHKTQIQISSMYKDNRPSEHATYNYIHNYPVDILHTETVNSLLYIHQMQWQQNQEPQVLDYNFKKRRSATALLITLKSTNLEWKKFEIGILLTGEKYKNQLQFGEISILGNNNKQIQESIKHSLSGVPKIISYITGIQVSTFQSAIEVDVTSSQSHPQNIIFTINVGNSNTLSKIHLNYIIYRDSNQNQKVSGQIISTKIIGKHYREIKETLPSNYYYIFGVAGFKFKQPSSEFSLHFTLLDRNILSIENQKVIHYLKVNYFAISHKSNDICSQCVGNSISYNGWENQCLRNCNTNQQVKFENSIQFCHICRFELNQTYSSQTQKCICSHGYQNVSGRCVFPQDTNAANSQVTFSLSQSDCLEENMKRDGTGRCVCADGYQNQNGKCQRLCQNGIWKQGSCSACPPGTFPWQQLPDCLACVKYCKQCQSQYLCKVCEQGFSIIDGVCFEICGDGKREISECDDENNRSGDGCSSDCFVQKGFACSPIFLNGRDYCNEKAYSVQNLGQKIEEYFIVLQFKSSPQEEYTKNELKEMIKIQADHQNEYPRTAKYSQLNENKNIRIVLDYAGQLPLHNFTLTITFQFPHNSQTINAFINISSFSQIEQRDI